VKPLLHDEVQFHNGNCTIRFNDEEEEEEEEFVRIQSNQNTKSIIRTSDMSPGEIFSSVLDKSDGYL
jgi:hypothetical protein